MAYREVKTFGSEFPTHDQMLSGDPGSPPWPKEVWLQQTQPGEFAVRYKDFKTGLPRSPQGEHVESSEVCRIFDSLAEARTNSRQVVAEHWTVTCVVYDHACVQVESISNNTKVGSFALSTYAAILLWGGLFTLAGMAFLWIVGRLALLLLGREPPLSLHWFEWYAFAITGLAISVAVWFARLRWIAAKRAWKIRSSCNRADFKRFEELHSLHGSSDPAQRERFLKLARQYQDRVRQTLKK